MTAHDYMTGIAEYLHSTRYGMVGSTYIMGHGKDLDFLFLVNDLTEAAEFLHRKRFTAESEKYDINQFMSWRTRHEELGEVNVLVTADEDFFTGFLTAAEVCKYLAQRGYLDIAQRDVRVKLHQIIRDGEDA